MFTMEFIKHLQDYVLNEMASSQSNSSRAPKNISTEGDREGEAINNSLIPKEKKSFRKSMNQSTASG